MASQTTVIETMLDKMWRDYLVLNPEAEKIHRLFEERGENVVNDHIALRTFNLDRMRIEDVARPFEALGYKASGEYVFKEKKLFARHYENEDPDLPKIFISELEVEKFSKSLQTKIHTLVSRVDRAHFMRNDLSFSGRPWNLSYQDYLMLADESEYASWVAAYGFRPNHFTVSINHLKTFQTVESINEFLKAHGIRLNTSGGEVKGGPQELLAQSSTMASHIPVTFENGVYSLPGCYYEFALRYAKPDGKLYQGFVAASADKIFESTNR